MSILVKVITDKLDVDGAVILPPISINASFLRVFKARQSYTERREVETTIWCHRGSNSRPRTLKARTLTNSANLAFYEVVITTTSSPGLFP